jgi:FkbM family methyltransferase
VTGKLVVGLLERTFADVGRSIFQRWVRPRLPAALSGMSTDRFGFRMHLDLRQTLDVDCAFGHYDADEIQFLAAAYEEGTHFVDVGANIGIYTLVIKKMHPRANILAFEPDPATLKRFRDNLEVNGFQDVETSAYAISDRDGPAVLMLNQLGNSANNSLLEVYPPHDAVAATVEGRTLLSALREFGVRRVSSLKIDIEGYEYPVLRRFLEEAPRELWPKAVAIESWGGHIQTFGESPIQLLIRSGYRLVNHSWRWANFFFLLDAPQ